jgi:hypothetical protein
VSRKKPSSATIVWDFKLERFRLLFDLWNVDRAKQIVKDKPRPINEIALEPFRRFIGKPGQVVFVGVAVDWKKARGASINLDDPLLLAYGSIGLFPIDGWHRIAKGLLLGRKTLPYVKLTKEESKRVHTYTGRRRRR